jgi:signal peptidase I
MINLTASEIDITGLTNPSTFQIGDTGSMVPTLQNGDTVLAVPTNELNIGDVGVYLHDVTNGVSTYFLHRVIDKKVENGVTYYQFKGDHSFWYDSISWTGLPSWFPASLVCYKVIGAIYKVN